MWTLVLFDLPSEGAAAQRAYGRFRNLLRRSGFEALQKSAYCRWEDSPEATATLRRRILAASPGEGHVAVFAFSDRAWEGLEMRVDGVPRPAPPKPEAFIVWQ